MEENNNVELTEVNEEKVTDVSTVTENEVDSYEDDEEGGSTALGFAIGIAVAAVGVTFLSFASLKILSMIIYLP